MSLTRMIFAIQMTDTRPTRLRVSGDVGTPAPVMTCLRRGDPEPSSVPCVNGSWTTDLAAGDYLVEIQVVRWVAGRLDIVAELAPGQPPPTFVYYGPTEPGPSSVGLVAWQVTSLYLDPPESSITNDSKDPWPPPRPFKMTSPPIVKLVQVSSDWFTSELMAARNRIAGQIAGKSIPDSILDALVIER